MYDIWDENLKKVWGSFTGKAAIDNWVFRLHYMATTLFFVAYSILVTMNTYVGDPIDCMHNTKHKWGDYLDSYCFLHGTSSSYHPNGGSFLECQGESGGKAGCERVEHPQYMWVSFMVIAQAGLSYLPYYLWNGWEGGKMEALVQPLLESPEFMGEDPNESQRGAELCKCGSEATNRGHSMQSLSSGGRHGTGEGGEGPHLYRSGNKKAADLASQFLEDVGHNVRYSVKHGAAEWICLVVCFLQIYLTNFFLNGAFLTYGQEAVDSLSQDPFDRRDPMERTFPIVTSCKLEKFGTGGYGDHVDALCVLPNNIVHQKFYLALWFWLFAITIVTLLHQLYRICLLTIPAFRVLVTKSWWTPARKSDLSMEVDKVVEQLSYPDWIVLSLIHTNLTTVNFQNFLEDLAYQHNPKSQ